jgi:hypothetical protein
MRYAFALVPAAVFGAADSVSRTKMTTCDSESDSTKVKANYRRNNASTGNVYDVDGNNGRCGSGWVNTANPDLYVVEHKTCEYRTAWPDECGNWVAA